MFNVESTNLKTIFFIFFFALTTQTITFTNIGKADKGLIPLKDSTEIFFNILPDKIKGYKKFEGNKQRIQAEVKLTNLGDKDLDVTKAILYGLEWKGDNFVEAFDFDGNKINIENEIDYDYILIPDFFDIVTLKTNEFKIDTIDLSLFYYFGQKGDFKLRFIYKELNITSNWDTLKVY